MMTNYRILYKNEEVLPQYNVLIKFFIKIYVSKYRKGLLGQKKTIDSYVENDIFQTIGVNILHTKFKCNIVKYKLNVYKTSAK